MAKTIDAVKEDKAQALDLAVTQIEREFGKGAIMKLGDNTIVGTEVISTGILPLDMAIGVGGVPKGRIIEIASIMKKYNKRPF